MWYFRQRTRKWSWKISKIIFSSRKIDFKKKFFENSRKFQNIFFANFEILVFGGSSATPMAPYASGDVSWVVFDGFGARGALAHLRGTFFSGFPVDFLSDSLSRSSRGPRHLLTWTTTVLRSKIDLSEVRTCTMYNNPLTPASPSIISLFDSRV